MIGFAALCFLAMYVGSARGWAYVSLNRKFAPSKKVHAMNAKITGLSRALSMKNYSTPPKIIIAGAPASGKGSQCELLKERYGMIHLSTGDMLREAVGSGTDLGKQVKDYMDAGQLVPDDLIIGIVQNRLIQPDCSEKGWLLDGFPRTEAQAKVLADCGITADHFIILDVPDELLVERVVGRRTDPVSGRIYHMKYFPPESEEIKQRLIQRTDDTEEKIMVRIEAFKKNCDAVSGCYEAILLRLDGTRRKEAIFNDIIDAIEKNKNKDDAPIDLSFANRNQTSKLGSLLGFVLVDNLLRNLFETLQISFPSSLAGMMALFVGLCGTPSSVSKSFVDAAAPGAAFLALWLPVFFAPSLITLPLSPSIPSSTLFKLAALIIIGHILSLLTTAVTVLFLRGLPINKASGLAGRENVASQGNSSVFPKEVLVESLIAALGTTAAVAMMKAFQPNSSFLTVVRSLNMLLATLGGYILGTHFPLLIRRMIHPVVTCTGITWLFALIQSRILGNSFADVLGAYTTGSKTLLTAGAGDLLLGLLGPSILSFALQMYQRRVLIKENMRAVFGGTLFASISGLFGTAAAARALYLPSSLGLASISRNITSPLAIAIASALGAEVSIAVAIVVVTGIIGANFGALMLDLAGITDPISRGLSQGASSHGLGAAAMVNESDAFPFAAISMALTATFSTVLVNIGPIRKALVKLAMGSP